VHRPATLRPDDAAFRAGIPVTSLIRTLMDAARTDEQRAVKAKIRQAERLYRIDLAELAARSPRARRALELYVPGDVHPGLEAPFLELCRRYGVPLPQCQVPIGPYRVDFLWPAERLIVETDGAQTHATAIARADDAIRDRYLTDRGFEVRRYGPAEITRRHGATAQELLAALVRRQPGAKSSL
jgi:hypothetical protein